MHPKVMIPHHVSLSINVGSRAKDDNQVLLLGNDTEWSSQLAKLTFKPSLVRHSSELCGAKRQMPGTQHLKTSENNHHSFSVWLKLCSQIGKEVLGSQRGGAINDVCVLQGGVAGVWCEAWGSLLLQKQQGVGALVQHSSRHIQRHLRPNLRPVPSQAEVIDPSHALEARDLSLSTAV
ncbi:hypothetical protein E2C01_028054 [Portunus trituberculatus]|uniref:Uncharacterized protein n=1 Tax=Portunus trituberculatus TaxID=210409 RepID=A0A5B7EMW2_PORTR|nr:hypothetical protein [Portunus trituberculatus]